MSRRPPSRAWRILRPWHTRRGRRVERIELEQVDPPPPAGVHIDGCTIHGGGGSTSADPGQPVWPGAHRWWPGPDLSPSTTELLVEDEIRREIEAKRLRGQR